LLQDPLPGAVAPPPAEQVVDPVPRWTRSRTPGTCASIRLRYQLLHAHLAAGADPAALTPDTSPLATPTRHTRRTFEQTVQLLELFLHCEGRAPNARETIQVDGEAVRIGAWLAKTRSKHRSEGLPVEHARLVAVLFDDDWTTDGAAPAVLA
jgi:hypothetical protein